MLAQFLIFSTVLCLSINAQITDNSVIIVGAGISGYSAARKLMENGFNDITILEASGRIGGRIYSVPFSVGSVDSGAQWVHGSVGNSIYQLVTPHFSFGSTPIPLYDPIFVLSNGTIPQQINFEMLYSLGSSLVESINSMTDAKGSVGDLFLTKYDLAVSNATYRHIDVATQNFISEQVHKDVNGYYSSSSWFDVSAKLNSLTEFADGDQHQTWKRQGFFTIFDYITKKLPNPSQYLNIDSKVRFNKKVTNIRYTTSNPLSKSTVTCADGTTYTANHVIFTGSVGVLKKYQSTLFTPALPAKKASAITNIAIGNVAKFFMEFDNTFWITPGEPFLQYAFMWSEAHKNEAKALNRGWMIDIVGIYAVDQFPNVLQLFLSGGNTNAFEMANDATIINDVMWMLDKFLPQLRPIPRPKAVHKTKWLTDDNFLGSYSYPSITQENNLVTNADLASSITATDGKPLVLFAGEATSSEFPSMAHGALDSGIKAAEEILDYHI